MNVLYDDQIFHYQRFGGISRYFFELFIRFQVPNEVRAVIPFRYTNNEYLLSEQTRFQFVKPEFLGGLTFPGKGRLWTWRDKLFPKYHTSLQNRKNVLARLAAGDIDIFHPTYFDDYYSGKKGNVPVVLTVYDMIYERFPESFRSDDLQQVLKDKRTAINNADHLIVISQSVKKDLMSFYSVDEKKISVVYLGNSLKSKTGAGRSTLPANIPESYLLFVGNRDGYKNFLFSVRAIADILRQRRDLQVVCTGKPFTREELKVFRELSLDQRMHHTFADDEQLAALYTNAAAFIYPSRYEGFGIPIIEAMNCGCPVILSNTSSFPEIAGDAAVYFDPENSGSISSAVTSVLEDGTLRAELVRQGKERSQLFTWERTMRETAEVYRRLLHAVTKH
jgi:glycosyltransferase involved in cell wall biosynthesis